MAPVGGLDAGAVDLAPLRHPLAYPGAAPARSGVLVDDRYVDVPGGVAALDGVLARHDAAPLADRSPVVAIGSNASPAQLRAKLAEPAERSTRPGPVVVPMVKATVRGIARGHSAHVSRPGYVAATPVVVPEGIASVFVIFLDAGQLAVVDATEPNYRRVAVDGGAVVADSGERVDGCTLYTSLRGALAGIDGGPQPGTSQRELLASLLARSAPLRDLAGPTPESFVERLGSPDPGDLERAERRDRARRIFEEAGWVLGP